MSKEKLARGYGEQRGYVERVLKEVYMVKLDCHIGMVRYEFPKRLSSAVLKKNDQVRCYVVDSHGKLEPRLEKIVWAQESLDPKRVNREYEEAVDRELPTLLRDLRPTPSGGYKKKFSKKEIEALEKRLDDLGERRLKQIESQLKARKPQQ